MTLIPKKNVTEADLEATEARLSESLSGIKEAVFNLPSEAARPVTDQIQAHPFASMAVAAGTGFLAFQLVYRLMTRTKVVTREVSVEPEVKVSTQKRRSFVSRLIAGAITAASPYVMGYVQNEAMRLVSGLIKEKPAGAEETTARPYVTD